MKKLLIAILLLGGASGAASASCSSINSDIEENLKDMAATKTIQQSYYAARYYNKATALDSEIANNQNQINLLLTQSKSLKCKPYTGSLNPNKYMSSAKKCSDLASSGNMDEINFKCDRKNWKSE